jgi:hypothetical protein
MRPSDSCLPIGPGSLGSLRTYRRVPAMISLPLRLTGDRRAWVLVDRLTREAEQTAGTDRPPRFLGNPEVTAPTSKDPGGTPLPGQYRRAGAAPACAHGRGSRDETNFGAEWAGSGHRLSTLRPYSRLQGRKTRFRLLARLYRVGSMTHWVPPKGFELFPTSLLLSQASPGASALRSGTPEQLRHVSGGLGGGVSPDARPAASAGRRRRAGAARPCWRRRTTRRRRASGRG